MSDTSDDGVVYQCKKCPKLKGFQTKQEFAQHRKKIHPKEKSRRQIQEEEAEEERSMLESMRRSPSVNRVTRQSPRTVGAAGSPSDEQENLQTDGDEAEDSGTADEAESRSKTGKRGRPAGGKPSPKKGKPSSRPQATSTPVSPKGPKGRKAKPGPKSKSKAVAPWMDEDYSQSRFSGG